MSHRALAGLLFAATLVLDCVMGILFAAVEHVSVGLGIYWAIATATTVGYGDVTPRGAGAHVIAVVTMLTVIPLWGFAFSLITSWLSSLHLRGLREHVTAAEHRIHEHLATGKRPEGGGDGR